MVIGDLNCLVLRFSNVPDCFCHW